MQALSIGFSGLEKSSAIPLVGSKIQLQWVELRALINTHALIGANMDITSGGFPESSKQQIIAELLCITGIRINAAVELAGRPAPNSRRKA
jgi:hypothetical protein